MKILPKVQLARKQKQVYNAFGVVVNRRKERQHTTQQMSKYATKN